MWTRSKSKGYWNAMVSFRRTTWTMQYNDIMTICKNIQTKQKTRKRWKLVHFVYQQSVGETCYHSIMSINSYFKPVNNESLLGEALQTSTGEESSTHVLCCDRAKCIDATKREKLKSGKSFLRMWNEKLGSLLTNMGYQQLVNGPLTATRVMNSKEKRFVIGAISIALCR